MERQAGMDYIDISRRNLQPGSRACWTRGFLRPCGASRGGPYGAPRHSACRGAPPACAGTRRQRHALPGPTPPPDGPAPGRHGEMGRAHAPARRHPAPAGPGRQPQGSPPGRHQAPPRQRQAGGQDGDPQAAGAAAPGAQPLHRASASLQRGRDHAGRLLAPRTAAPARAEPWQRGTPGQAPRRDRNRMAALATPPARRPAEPGAAARRNAAHHDNLNGRIHARCLDRFAGPRTARRGAGDTPAGRRRLLPVIHSRPQGRRPSARSAMGLCSRA